MSDWLPLDKAVLKGLITTLSGMLVVAVGVIIGVINKKVSKDAFVEYKISIDKQFKNVNNHLEEIKKDVKDLLNR